MNIMKLMKVMIFTLFFCSFHLSNSLAQASIIDQLVAQIDENFINLSETEYEDASDSSQTATKATEKEGEVLLSALFSEKENTAAQSGAGVSAASAAEPPTEETKTSTSSKPRLIAMSKLPVSQRLFRAVMNLKDSSGTVSTASAAARFQAAIDPTSESFAEYVRFKSVGALNSVEEFFSILNQIAKEEGSLYRFRLPKDEDYQRAVGSHQLTFTHLAEWTNTSAELPYRSKLVLEFSFDDELEKHIVIDEDNLDRINRMFILPTFSSRHLNSGFRMVIEEKPKFMKALVFDID